MIIIIIQFGFEDTKFMAVEVTDSLDDKLPNNIITIIIIKSIIIR